MKRKGRATIQSRIHAKRVGENMEHEKKPIKTTGQGWVIFMPDPESAAD